MCRAQIRGRSLVGDLTRKKQKDITKQDSKSGRPNDMGGIERNWMQTVVPQTFEEHCAMCPISFCQNRRRSPESRHVCARQYGNRVQGATFNHLDFLILPR